MFKLRWVDLQEQTVFVIYGQNIQMHMNPKKTRNTDDSLGSGTKPFITFLTFRFSTRGESDTQFLLCWLFHLTGPRAAHSQDPTRFVQSQISTHWPNKHSRILQQTTGLALPKFESQLASNCFLKILKNPSPSLPGMTSFKSPVLFPIRVFFIMTSEREHLHSMCTHSRALSRKVLSLTKPKDKI